MRIVKLWILAAILAGAVLAVLAITETIPSEDMPELAWKSFGVLLILAASHMGLDMMRGRADTRDETDKPVP